MRVSRLAALAVCLAAGSVLAQPTSQPVTIFNDPTAPADAKDVQFTKNLECASAEVDVQRLSPSHYVIRSAQTVNTGGQYFLLHVSGVAGRTVEFDFDGAPFSKWGNSIPLFSYAEDLSSLESFDPPAAGSLPAELTQERVATDDTAPSLPDTAQQTWHYFRFADHAGERIAVRQHFDQDAAYIAFKIPYTPAYNDAFLDSMHDEPALKLVEVGKSRDGRPLTIAVIAKDVPSGQPARPCVLIYAREHPDDQDGSWITQGAINALLSQTPEMSALRDQCDFLLIPMLDPDGSAAASHGNIIFSFTQDGRSPEAKAYMDWFKQWFTDGHRVDVAISLHSSVPGSNFHIACPMMEPDGPRLTACQALHQQIRDALVAQNFAVRNTPWQKGVLPQVLSGWLQQKYGTLVLPYVSASLQSKQQLNLTQLRQIGTTIVKGSAAFLGSADGQTLLHQIDDQRAAMPTTAPAQ